MAGGIGIGKYRVGDGTNTTSKTDEALFDRIALYTVCLIPRRRIHCLHDTASPADGDGHR
jgi:hypothetical protein